MICPDAMHLQLNARCIIMMSIEEGNDGRRDFRMKAAPASRPHAHDKASKFVTCVEDGKQPVSRHSLMFI